MSIQDLALLMHEDPKALALRASPHFHATLPNAAKVSAAKACPHPESYSEMDFDSQPYLHPELGDGYEVRHAVFLQP